MIAWALAAWAAPTPSTSCVDLAARLPLDKLPDRPAGPSYWWLEGVPCPAGTELAGPLPPQAREVWCVYGKARTGPSTTLSGDLKILSQTKFARNLEIGPRVDFDPASQRAVAWTEFAADVPSGRMIEWTDGGTLVSWVKKGVKEGPTYKLDLRGKVEFVEFWTSGVRATRSCVWRDGALVIDTP